MTHVPPIPRLPGATLASPLHDGPTLPQQNICCAQKSVPVTHSTPIHSSFRNYLGRRLRRRYMMVLLCRNKISAALKNLFR